MNALHAIAAAGLALVVAGHTAAAAIEPIHAQSIDVAGLTGVAYYSVEEDGFDVVSTLAHADGITAPLRVKSVLGSGECISFSTPGAVGTVAGSFDICRQGDALSVQQNRNVN